MAYETFFAVHPIDGPKNDFAITVLVYTLLTMWLENFIKVQQSHLSQLQQQQMDRIEYMMRYLREQNDAMKEMLAANNDQGKIVHHLIGVLNRLTKQFTDLVESKEA